MNGRRGHLLAARCVMRALGGGAEGRRRRGLQGSVWGRRARESAAMRKMLWAGQSGEVLAARIHYARRDVEGFIECAIKRFGKTKSF